MSTTLGELCPPVSDPLQDTNEWRPSSPPWIAKLCASVWEEETDNLSGSGSSILRGNANPAQPQRPRCPEAFPGSESFPRIGENTAVPNWRALASCKNDLGELVPQAVGLETSSGGYTVPSPIHFQSFSPSSGQESWISDSSGENSVRSSSLTPLTPMSQETTSRHQTVAWLGDERGLSTGDSPTMGKTIGYDGFECGNLRPLAPANNNAKRGGYPYHGTLSNGNGGFASTVNAQSSPGFQSPSWLCRSPNGIKIKEHGRNGNTRALDFHAHVQTLQNPKSCSFQQHRTQLQHYGNHNHNHSLFPDTIVDFCKSQEIPRPIHISGQKNGMFCNDRSLPTTTADDCTSYTPSPQPFEMNYRNDHEANPNYLNYPQPQLGNFRTACSSGGTPGMADGHQQRFPKGQSYYPEKFRPYQDPYFPQNRYGVDSPRYQRPSAAAPVSPANTHCPLPTVSGANCASPCFAQGSSAGMELSQQSLDTRSISSTSSDQGLSNGDASNNGLCPKVRKRLRDSSPEAPKKAEKQPRGAQNLPPCRVCGNKASGLHFGVNTCEACNEFFRRSLKRGANYHCSRNLTCKVWGKKRSPCSSCRYRRCLEVGMSRNRIKTGRYSHRTRAEYAQEIERNKRDETFEQERERVLSMLETLVANHDRYIRNSSHIPMEDIIRSQHKFLRTFNAKSKRERDLETKEKECLHENDNNKACQDTNSSDGSSDQRENKTSVSAEINSDKVEETSSQFQNIGTKNAESTTCRASNARANKISTKASFDTSNVDTISSESTNPSTNDRLTSFVDDERTLSATEKSADDEGDAKGDGEIDEDDDSSPSSNIGLTKVDAEITERWLRCYITYAKLVPGFKRLPISDQASLVRSSWFEFWFLGAHRGFNKELKVVTYPIGHALHESQMVRVFGEEYSSYCFHLADRLKNLELFPEEMVLMKTLCLLSPDRCELKDKVTVENMHWTMVSALMHILMKNRPKEKLLFPRIVGKMVELR